MKKLIVLLLMGAFTAAFGILNTPYSNAYDNTGTLTYADKAYISVKNNSGAARADGDVMIFDVAADDGGTVTGVATAGLRAACVFDAACASGATCKCQVFGKHDAVKTDVTNHTVTASYGLATSGAATKAEGKPLAEGGGFATALDTSAVSGTVEAIIHAL